MCPFLLNQNHFFKNWFLNLLGILAEPFFNTHPPTPVAIITIDGVGWLVVWKTLRKVF